MNACGGAPKGIPAKRVEPAHVRLKVERTGQHDASRGDSRGAEAAKTSQKLEMLRQIAGLPVEQAVWSLLDENFGGSVVEVRLILV